MEKQLKYLVLGAGGTGGPIGGYLTRAGKDVTLIARGRHLEAMKSSGLEIQLGEEDFLAPVKACSMEEYREVPDVVFVCVKGYSLEEAADFIKRIADAHTVVIPILNIYGTGGKLQERLPDMTVTDGCIYIASQIKEPGKILMSGKIFRVVYGLRKGTPEETVKNVMPVLKKIEADLKESQILPVLSPQIVDPNHPFPHLLNKEIYVVANLKQGSNTMTGIVPVPQYIPEVLYLPGHDIRYIRMEKVIMEYLELVFDKYEVSDKNYICVTRNADISPDDEAYADNEDFRFIMKETLHKRRRMAVVRLETASPLGKEMEKYLCDRFKITPECIFRTKMPMKL